MTTFFLTDEDGRIIPVEDVQEWALRMRGVNRRVAKDDIGSYMVSTVFLGIDHSFGDGPPVLWETMVFHNGSFGGEFQWRYETLEDAKRGHELACALLRGKLGKPELTIPEGTVKVSLKEENKEQGNGGSSD